MIAKNFLRFPSAMALQMPLAFGTALRWATARPTTMVARTIRAARGAAFKAGGRVKAVVKRKVPAWWTEQQRRGKRLAARVKALLMGLLYTD